MAKRKFKIITYVFILSLLLLCLIYGLLTAGFRSKETAFPLPRTVFSMELPASDVPSLEVEVMGHTANYDLTLLNTVEGYRKEYFFLTPAPIRLLEQGIYFVGSQGSELLGDAWHFLTSLFS